MHTASLSIEKNLSCEIESIEGKADFQAVWDNIIPDGM